MSLPCKYGAGLCAYTANGDCEKNGKCLGGWPFPEALPTHPEGELSGEQIEEIHEWLTVLPFAENMKAAQAKHIEQMNALCNMALRTHDLQARLDAAMVDAEKWREQQRLLRSNGHDIDEFYKDDAAILAEKERNNG